MRQQFKKQQEHRRNPAIRGPYEWIGKLYARFSTSFMLENTSSVARDHLANERTFLAWLRTSLSLITVGVAITQLYHLTPQTGGDNTNQVTQAKIGKALGGVFVIFSIVFLYFANARYFHTQLAMTKGQFPASRGAVVFGSTCILAVLVAMFVVIVSDLR
ncbi:hypothetical protein BDF20DRAFT_899390 [Mycotypha africana]|uniref:uncharacterized protein n=1 Tax=Mycotypha africana TaxID=64632 RepID=UPI0023004084|nr:uncharacterized protein BDF20DRAFT_899390 [Mycotypha africana]KAI8967806.1 hypothetical protein BDF20DRAFT_899390 [Mycotypha africana]